MTMRVMKRRGSEMSFTIEALQPRYGSCGECKWVTMSPKVRVSSREGAVSEASVEERCRFPRDGVYATFSYSWSTARVDA